MQMGAACLRCWREFGLAMATFSICTLANMVYHPSCIHTYTTYKNILNTEKLYFDTIIHELNLLHINFIE